MQVLLMFLQRVAIHHYVVVQVDDHQPIEIRVEILFIKVQKVAVVLVSPKGMIRNS